jgi:probable HAF family extracellular repeat protein
MHDICPPEATEGAAFGINSSGEVVGAFRTATSRGLHAFVYSSALGFIDLNQQIDPRQHWELGMAMSINDAGQIAGEGRHNGQERGFLLIPKRVK